MNSAEYLRIVGPFGQVSLSVISRPIRPHVHFGYNWMFKVRGPDFEIHTPSGSRLVTDNNVLILNPLDDHGKPQTATPSLLLSLQIETAWLNDTYAKAGIALQTRFPRELEDLTDEIRECALRIVSLLAQDGPSDEPGEGESVEDLVRELALAMGRAYLNPNEPHPRETRPVDFRISRALRRLNDYVNYIDDMQSKKETIASVAQQIGLSRSRFFERFKECNGISPHCYVESIKLARAMQLLNETSHSISDIAAETGFSEHTHFTRFFVKQTGMPPSVVQNNQCSTRISGMRSPA